VNFGERKRFLLLCCYMGLCVVSAFTIELAGFNILSRFILSEVCMQLPKKIAFIFWKWSSNYLMLFESQLAYPMQYKMSYQNVKAYFLCISCFNIIAVFPHTCNTILSDINIWIKCSLGVVYFMVITQAFIFGNVWHISCGKCKLCLSQALVWLRTVSKFYRLDWTEPLKYTRK